MNEYSAVDSMWTSAG